MATSRTMTREDEDPLLVSTSKTMTREDQDSPPQVATSRTMTREDQDPPLLRAEHATIEGCALLLLPAVSGCGTVRCGASLLVMLFSNFYFYWFYLKWVWDLVLGSISTRRWSDKIQ